MTKTRSTKRALILSMMSLLLCAAMLIGTTYAWFTESVSSVNNIITGGNLDVELWYKTVDPTDPTKTTEWAEVDANTNVFTDALWEPGHTQVVYLKVVNKGTLSLKYQLGVNVASELAGINEKGEIFRLSDYIEYSVMDGEKTGDRATLRAEAAKAEAMKLREGYSKSNKLFPVGEGTSEEIVTMVVYMPETVGNEANHKTGTVAPTLNLGINLIASQYTWENDSFGPDYDETAPWTGDVNTSWYNTTDKSFTLTTAEQLAGLAQIVNAGTDTFKGKTVVLGANIDLNNAAWTPIGTKSADGEKAFTRTFAGTFDGAGYTVSNLYVSGGNALGLFGRIGTGAHIEDLTIDGAYVSGTDYVGAIAGYAYLAANCIKNCVVTDAEIIATPFLLATGEFDGGAKAGVIVGYALNGNLIGNIAKDSSVIAYRDLGGIAGMLNADGIGARELIAEDNKVSGVTLSYVGVMGTYADEKSNENMNDVVGRLGSKSSVGANTVEKVTKNETGAVVLYTADDLYAFARSVNGGNTYAGKTVLLGADIDLENKDWTPIGNSTNKFQGTFDGNNKTIKNLKVNMPGKSNAGLFGMTTQGEVKNLTVENATVTGRLNVGVVAGTPYTSKYSNITVKGHVEVNGMSYVGGVGGKNAYANWTNITVNVDETSYVNANSVENGTAYRTYVGGVVGFNGEGGHTFKNITSNINVIGTTCDVGGAFGIAHYGNNFENVTVTGNVTITGATEAADAEEMGGIAGVWMNSGSDVTFTDCKFTGTLSANVTEGVDLSDNTITGKGYYANTSNNLIIRNYYEENGVTYYRDGVTEEVVLYSVSNKAPETLYIPENVTALRSGSFTYNTTVKTLYIPKSVVDFGGTVQEDGAGASGGAFKNNDSVETIILEEGITEIPGSAFSQAKKITSINFPSTLTTIGVEAFEGVTIAELKIPATVTKIGHGAFRGMPNLTTVTIEGDTEIANYAFRSCGLLENVYLNGMNVTFTGTSQVFTNNDSTNSGVVNVFVKTDVVKERLLNATSNDASLNIVVKMTAKEGGYYTNEEGTVAYAYTSEALVEAIKALSDPALDVTTVVLSADVETEAATKAPYGNKVGLVQNGGVIDGNGKTLSVECYGDDYGIMTSGGTIKNLKIDSGCRAIMIMSPTEDIILDNVYVCGDILYPINTGEHATESGIDLIVTNSTFGGWSSFAGIESASFTNCTFIEGGYGYGWPVDSFVRPYVNTTFTGCEFALDGDGNAYYLDLSALGAGCTVTLANCTVNGTKVTSENCTGLFGEVELPAGRTLADCIVFG